MSYKYSQVRVIHFDFNSPEFLTFWRMYPESVDFKGEIKFNHYDPPINSNQNRVVFECKYRFYNDKGIQIGSYIAEIYFLLAYETDVDTMMDILNIFDEVNERTKNNLHELLSTNGLALIDLGSLPIDSGAAEVLLSSLRAASGN